MQYDNIILGGGASGLFCGANLKKGNNLLIEGSNKLGIKVLASGSGQCNITNILDIKKFVDKYGDNGKKVRKILYNFNNLDVIDYFEKNDVPIIIREDGKVFPKSFKSGDIVSALVSQIKKNKIDIITDTKIVKIEKRNKEYILQDKNGKEYRCKNLVVAVGGKSYKQTGSDGEILEYLEKNFEGINLVDMREALVAIFVEDYLFSNNAGISIKKVALKLNKDKKVYIDDLLFTHKNISGPVIINNSRKMNNGDTITINFLNNFMTENEMNIEDIIRYVDEKLESKKKIVNWISEEFDLPKNFVDIFVDNWVGNKILKESDKNKSVADLGKKKVLKIVERLSSFSMKVSGNEGFNKAMVTAGGVDLKDMNLKTLQHNIYENLYFVGECLDIDGDTGGYNIQFAFSSGYLVAQHLNIKKDVEK